jgi:carboxymethylenebutenolidase
VPGIEAAMLIQSAEDDERINAMWPDYEAALKAADVTYEHFVYPGTRHGFHNNSTPRFDPAAAELAEQRTMDFFRQHLA